MAVDKNGIIILGTEADETILDKNGIPILVSKKLNLNEAKRKYEIQREFTHEAIKQYDEDYKKVLETDDLKSTTPFYNPATLKPTFKKNAYDIRNQSYVEIQKKIEPYKEFLEDSLFNKEKELNDLKYYEYLYNVAKVDNEKTTLYDKTLGNMIRALIPSTMLNQYKDGDGKTIYLPTYSDLKNEKVRGDYSSKVGRFVFGDVLPGATKILASTAVNAITGTPAGSIMYFGDIFTKSYTNAVNEGQDEVKSLAYATVSTGLEFLTEKVLGGAAGKLTGASTGELSNLYGKGISKFVKNPKIASMIASAASEATEEFLQEYLDNINKLVTLDNSTNINDYIKTFLDDDIRVEALYAAGVGAATGGLVNATGANNFVVFRQELINKKIEIQNNKNLSDEVKNQKLEKINKTLNYLDDYLNKNISNEQNNVNNNLLKENEQKYQYLETNDSKINKLYQSASKYFNNSDTTTDMLNTISKVIKDKNYSVVFDDSIGNNVNGKIETVNGETEIKINPKSPRAVEFILTHEITHAIETDSLKELVMNYAQKNPDFNNSLTKLMQTYNTSEITSEVVADISGQLLGNQEFINSLTIENTVQSRNFIQKIYDAIVRLKNKLTKEGRYQNFLDDLESKWREAYQTRVDNLNNETYMSKNNIENNEHLNYNNNQFILPKNEYAKVSSVIHNKQSQNLNYRGTNFVYSDNYFYIFDDNGFDNFQIKDRIEIVGNEEKINYLEEAIKNGNNKTLNRWVSSDAIRQGINSNDNISIEKRRDSIENDRVSKDLLQESKKSTNAARSDRQNDGNKGLDNSSFSLKQKQNDIIQKNNPVADDYHTWIRSADDIKTFDETLQDSDYKEYYEAGENFDDSYTAEMAKKALETGKITVYSSYPIGQGVFVSPSKMEAESYSGDGKVYSKEVALTDVAWIDPTQGQYAKVSSNTRYSMQENKNYSSNGGYDGKSMSNRAREAYNDGEMPLSKWTKKEIISNIILNNNNSIDENLLNKMTVKELQDNFLNYSSWHHTGKFYNETNFYELNLEEIENITNDALNEIILSRKPREKLSEKDVEKRKIQKQQEIEIKEKSQDAYFKYLLIKEMGLPGYKSSTSILKTIDDNTIDSVYEKAKAILKERDKHKVDAWSRLEDNHWRKKYIDLYNNNIEEYFKKEYLNSEINLHKKEYQHIKEHFEKINEKNILDNDSYSKQDVSWQEHLEKNYKATGTRTFTKDILNGNVMTMNNVLPYTQHELDNFANGKITVVNDSQTVNEFVEKAKNTKSSNAKLYFGKIGSVISNKIKKALGIELKDYNISLKADSVKHIIDSHSSSNEYKRGQEPITADDFNLIPIIVSNYDTIEQSGKTENGKPILKFSKKIGNIYYLVNYVSDKNHTLEVQTMYKSKKKNSATAGNTQMSPTLTSEADSGTSSFLDVNNTTNDNKSQMVLPTKHSMQQKEKNDTKVAPILKKNVYSKSDIDNMVSFTDQAGRDIKLPDDVGIRLAYNTNIDASEIGNIQSIIYNSNIKQNGNALSIEGSYDNVNYVITAVKNGDSYIIDNMTKKIPNGLDSIASNKKVSYEKVVNDYKKLKESKFHKNITNSSKFITKENRQKLGDEIDINFYKSVSNEESLKEAKKRIDKGGTSEALRWLRQDVKTSNSVDVAEGWILLQKYQDAGDFNSMVEVAKKMREMGTIAGQTVQAYNIMARLTPEGMVKYAQSELTDAYEIYSKNKSSKWIDENQSKFDLTTEEVGFIVDTMKQVEKMEDGRTKNVKLAEIQKMLGDKLPPAKGDGIKAWMRISMLFNPKTQVRNVMGNAIIAPVNVVSDYIASKVDKAISNKTGVRTTGTTNLKNYSKGFKKGLFESYDDFKRGINTRNVQGNRFEINNTKSFNDKTKIGKSLNRIDNILSFMLDAGDRGFYEASFTNSINNQMVLNNTDTITQSMIDIATQEALSRTWQDNNNYTKFVLGVRNTLNKINVKGYGLGDVLIPFAKTPANLTKAIVDYSPVGMVNAITQGINLKNSLSNGQYNAKMQHQFVQTLGKATAGTMLYILGYALAKSGHLTGKSDDDKDVQDFMKNTLGISSYSIKIGNKSFTYDWAQPIAAPLSIMANINSSKNKNKALYEAIIANLDTAGSVLLEQSFLESINDVLNNNDGAISGIINEIMELSSRAVPTFSKQITDMIDGTQRTTYEYDKPVKSALNSIKNKIPGLSQTLQPKVDTLGREVKKYGGKNNIFNVFLNPANVNTENISDSAKEIYKVYKQTGDKTILPRVAPYYINTKGEKVLLKASEKTQFQKISGLIIEENIQQLINNDNYRNMSYADKSEVIKNIVDYAYNFARKGTLNIEMPNTYNKVNEWVRNGGKVFNYYANKEESDFAISSPTKYATLNRFGISYSDYLQYKNRVNEIKDNFETADIRKQKIAQYLDSLRLNKYQKIMLYKELGGYSITYYKNDMFQYINNMKLSKNEKEVIWNQIYGR